MKQTKSYFWNLLILFEIIFAIKLGWSLLRSTPFIYPDETCAINIAKHFIETFKLAECKDIIHIEIGSTMPLYSILIAPIYKFFSGVNSYKAVLALNGFLTTSLIFPLWGIFTKFIENKKHILISIAIILFLPQITTYEQIALTESIFVVLNIWLLHFYLNSFGNTKLNLKNKTVALFLSILAAFARPFGFIVPIAILVNELLVSKKKLSTSLKILPLIILPLIFSVMVYGKVGIIQSTLDKFMELKNLEAWIDVVKSVTIQINSFSMVTYIVPIILFFNYINTKDKHLQNIKYFILTLIFLNFAISAQHIFGYLTVDELNPGGITRYINISLILIYTFAIIFIQKFKTIKLSTTSIVFMAILFLNLLINKPSTLGMSLNTDISFYLDINKTIVRDIKEMVNIVKILLIPITLIICTLLIANKRKALIYCGILILAITAIGPYKSSGKFLDKEAIVKIFENTKATVLFVSDTKDESKFKEMWPLLSVTENTPTLVTIYKEKPDGAESIVNTIDKEVVQNTEKYKDADYLVTKYDIEGMVSNIRIGNDLNIYEINKNE